jgi:hypothetical protein
MTEPRMNDAEYAAYKPCLDEVIALVNQQIRRHPDPKVMEASWRMGYMTVLVQLVRGWRMLPDERDSYIRRCTEALVADTIQAVRDWDTEGPPR